MPVSKSKRKKKRFPQPSTPRLPEDDFTGGLDMPDFALADSDLDAELDTDAAIMELRKAGKGFRPSTLAAAEELMLQAWQAPDSQRHLDLALKAFELCPWCADAYGSLAIGAKGHPRMALHFRQIALAAAEFALDADWGQDLRRAYAENYWGHVATRAYMRAGAGLAQTLADTGALEPAVEHLEALLQLNPSDEQGLRYSLAQYLLLLGRDARLAELLIESADEDSAFVNFNFALVAFRASGDTKEARALLSAAIASNPYVAPYLLGHRSMRRPTSAEAYGPGGEDEAGLYVECTATAWRSTKGALDWLRRNTAGKL